MLDRLFAGLTSGPSLNCRPHTSRQRIDLARLGDWNDVAPTAVLVRLLSGAPPVVLRGRHPTPPRRLKPARRRFGRPAQPEDLPSEEPASASWTPEETALAEAWAAQDDVHRKLRIIAESARGYEQDTGAHVLYVGFPLLNLPPGSAGLSAAAGRGTRRILAPVAFIPVSISVRGTATPELEVSVKADEVDRLAPNTALLAWLERQTGRSLAEKEDESNGRGAWPTLCGLVRQVADVLNLTIPELFAQENGNLQTPPAPASLSDEPAPDGPSGPVEASNGSTEGEGTPSVPDQGDVPEDWMLSSCLRSDDGEASIELAAVLGLFPLNNQGLLRDLQALVAGEPHEGPMASFLDSRVLLEEEPAAPAEEGRSATSATGPVGDQRFIAPIDPCQARAVRMARAHAGLVIHGPPGTGKSQTITNIIGDHLARGQRVLVVCDKRTALDVVANRLHHLGLGHLCALVHDAQRDQRELYRSIREQLEGLAAARPPGKSASSLGRIDAELARLYAELNGFWSAIGDSDKDGASFHQLAGRWLCLQGSASINLSDDLTSPFTVAELRSCEGRVVAVFERAEAQGMSGNPWLTVARGPLSAVLSKPADHWRKQVESCVDAALAVDESGGDGVPAFSIRAPLDDQARVRSALAEELPPLAERLDPSVARRWAAEEAGQVRWARDSLDQVADSLDRLGKGTTDRELSLATKGNPPSLAELFRDLAALESWLEVAGRWYGLLFFGRRSRAAEALRRYGLPVSVESARRLNEFLKRSKARQILDDLALELGYASPDRLTDDALVGQLTAASGAVAWLYRAHSEAALSGLHVLVASFFTEPGDRPAILRGLRSSGRRVEAIVRLQERAESSGLFSDSWMAATAAGLREGGTARDVFEPLAESVDTLEDVLRLEEERKGLPGPLARMAGKLLQAGCRAGEGLAAMESAILADELARRMARTPALSNLDAQALESRILRIRSLEGSKRQLVLELILSVWYERQAERLLVTTGSRLSSSGADLRRRLTLRGEKSLRLRQVVAMGRQSEGGDPLYDLRPVWMASPETVAQVFPRQALFDVVIFDEASQCRLEEALPVLTRARRVVVAGDPKQLPPTRFFETAWVQSDEAELETEQDLFESQQAETEDLLSAALAINLSQCYLDVHYRSRSSELVEFSNQQFYSRRLQPLPGHPSRVLQYSPLTLYQVQGVYDERCNAVEADQVCTIVRDLLRRAEPPSIGVASFSLVQRDLIVERLDELAAEDREFARALGEARVRRGEGSFEGLFVKNLENVQGDERDHIIISTTYGPDKEGQFRRRFGPLGSAGGGRRLNVLVTRARHEVHLVTSIPPAVYLSLPPVPPGAVPGGGWLLFSYLAYAHQLNEYYRLEGEARQAESGPPVPAIRRWPTEAPSEFVEGLAEGLLRRHRQGSETYWGNDGFSVDLALSDPRRPGDVTVGLLCDGSRFSLAQGPLEWDLFRMQVLESMGWELIRVWTPHFFRQPEKTLRAVLARSAAVADAKRDRAEEWAG
jgi:hypothetical protein